MPSHFSRGSKSVARRVLQALEGLKMVEKDQVPEVPQIDTSGTERSGQNRRAGEAWVKARVGSLCHCLGIVRSGFP